MRHSPSRSPSRGRHEAAGFTLVELMITVAVLAIVLAIGVPSFSAMIRRNQLVSTANEISATMNLARMEAIRRNRRVEICPSTNGTTCSGSNWSRMIVREAAAGTLIRDVQIVGNGVSLTASSNVSTNDRFAFTPTGLARIGNANAAAGSLSACSSKLPAAENTLDVGIVASRIAVTPRNGGTTCSARTDG
jgi:type IV fimbrial biogenesis protein FimT